MDNETKVVILLEDLAWRLAQGILEKPQFLEKLYRECDHVSSQPETAAVHGDVRPLEPSTGPVPRPESSEGVQLQTKKRVWFPKKEDGRPKT